jgi:tripeptide aminopeptidase
MPTIHFDTRETAERFVRYASIYTQSEEGVADTPSTACQFDLARLLYRELAEMGASDVRLDEKKCYVYATIPATIPAASKEELAKRADSVVKKRENLAPILGLAAHMDTSNAVDARTHPQIHPRIIEHYDGGRILLNEKLNLSMGPEKFPELAGKAGKTLVVSDGTTVLGGDDKAGITQIMEAASFFLHHRDIAHGTIRIMFTPDEEVGNGTMNMDTEQFAVDYAYTVDGGTVGELEYENFNAASVVVAVQGVSAHPGSAKGIMRNALLAAMEYNELLPKEIPANTEGYEGFYHLEAMKGTADAAELEYIIRDHDRALFEKRKQVMKAAADTLNERYRDTVVTVTTADSYYNMAEKIRPHMHLVENAKRAMEQLGITPVVEPIRGGTDGARMSFMGIPCPNLFTGAYHYHGRNEYVVAEEMVLGAETIIRIMNQYAGYELDAD